MSIKIVWDDLDKDLSINCLLVIGQKIGVEKAKFLRFGFDDSTLPITERTDTCFICQIKTSYCTKQLSCIHEIGRKNKSHK